MVVAAVMLAGCGGSDDESDQLDAEVRQAACETEAATMEVALEYHRTLNDTNEMPTLEVLQQMGLEAEYRYYDFENRSIVLTEAGREAGCEPATNLG